MGLDHKPCAGKLVLNQDDMPGCPGESADESGGGGTMAPVRPLDHEIPVGSNGKFPGSVGVLITGDFHLPCLTDRATSTHGHFHRENYDKP